MAALLSPDTAPSPRPNPFAKATSQTSFSRSGSLLPLRSPSTSTPVPSGSTPQRKPWRLLWRGGLEVGPDGWRLDGITFFAMLDFAKDANAPGDPFAPPTPRPSTPNAALADADLCLSLESLRGRKYLPVRGLLPLADDELDSDDSVQLSVESPLLASFFASSLCAAPKLTLAGRTPLAIEVGLGDEGVEASTIVIYGQRRDADAALRLCVGRRAVVPSPRKVRPGEPLPRAPLLFPTKAARRPRPPLARATSSVYAPPPALSASASTSSVAVPDGRTPGRRGEKRPRKDGATGNEDDKRRRAGRIVKPVPDKDTDEDIFGRRSASLAPRAASVAPSASVVVESEADPPRTARRVPQQTLDNKAMIRKQALVALEARGVLRDHSLFKDVFSLVTKGTYFAVRRTLDSSALDKGHAQDIIRRHLDMYLDDIGGPDDGEATDKD
ncbi:uncharacterized protein LOC62_03G004491 [Vanrija pseudolonga]|uniref:Sld7 C-terminal domain-containing protein n=1 Tax=Vanrija pseudolonga TaxID=143232 RepID=A0AAF0YAA8_9TREE|nr:hypothetical protein LOC62_03G004491 [Vanrija pseudolonga]